MAQQGGLSELLSHHAQVGITNAAHDSHDVFHDHNNTNVVCEQMGYIKLKQGSKSIRQSASFVV